MSDDLFDRIDLTSPEGPPKGSPSAASDSAEPSSLAPIFPPEDAGKAPEKSNEQEAEQPKASAPTASSPANEKIREPAKVSETVRRLPWRDRVRWKLRRARISTWLNFRVWVPFLLNPFERRRLLRYPSRQFRDGMIWKVELPEACWQCGSRDELQMHPLSMTVRAFEYPIQILAGTLLGLVLVMVLQFLLPVYLEVGLCLLILLGGVSIFWAKSWHEEIEVTQCCCRKHQRERRDPEVAVYEDQLYLFLPTPKIVGGARKIVDARFRDAGRAAGYDERPMEWDDER